MKDIIDLIDNAIDGSSVSGDAMRWTPEPPEKCEFAGHDPNRGDWTVNDSSWTVHDSSFWRSSGFTWHGYSFWRSSGFTWHGYSCVLVNESETDVDADDVVALIVADLVTAYRITSQPW